MVPITRLYADADGHARFEDIEIPLVPDDPPPDAMSVSQPWQAAAVLLGHGPAGGSHPEQPEHRRQLVIGIPGRVEVTATGETRTFGPGDIPWSRTPKASATPAALRTASPPPSSS